MALPSTQPLDGEFWYILDDENNIIWRPRPNLRGDFYLGWLGQNKNVVGAGLVRVEQGQLTHICTHGTPYFWLQPHAVLPTTAETLRAQRVPGADSMILDISLAGWGLRNQTLPDTRPWSEAPISATTLQPLQRQAVGIILRHFRTEGEPTSRPEYTGLLARAIAAQPADPLDELLDLLKEEFEEPSVVPVLIELVGHDINVMPGYRESDFFERLSTEEELPSPPKVSRLVLSAIYHLAPLLRSPRLNGALFLNCLRQRHPFDVTWGADFLVKCFGMSSLVRLLLTALDKDPSDQVRCNALELAQELGYGFSVGLDDEVLGGLGDLLSREGTDAFRQVISSHLAFIGDYMRQRDAAAHRTG